MIACIIKVVLSNEAPLSPLAACGSDYRVIIHFCESIFLRICESTFLRQFVKIFLRKNDDLLSKKQHFCDSAIRKNVDLWLENQYFCESTFLRIAGSKKC